MTSADRLKKEKGFTLIELLIVIAIIGVLSSIVLSSLSSARAQASDSKVKSQLVNLRSAAEIYFTAHFNYGPSTSSCGSGMFADAASGMAALAKSANAPAGGDTIVCNSNGSAYAASDNMSVTGTFWCVDSNGSSKQESAALGAAVACS